MWHFKKGESDLVLISNLLVPPSALEPCDLEAFFLMISCFILNHMHMDANFCHIRLKTQSHYKLKS